MNEWRIERNVAGMVLRHTYRVERTMPNGGTEYLRNASKRPINFRSREAAMAAVAKVAAFEAAMEAA
jgi:hypothetical protein